ncbi:MAG TPA: PEP-utilizing enzyme, partial [Xanthomonadaceae bacterium]|nr:PEP-utilizing enzyme [Xanthomonadaceae bacterium]
AALRDLAVTLENRFAWPQDCEWAFAEGVLWLLQTRPITRMAARWTRDESAERFPNAMTRLTWSVIFGGFNRSFRNSMENILQAPFYRGPWFERIDSYVYGDTTAAALYALHFQRKWLEGLSQGIDVEPSLQALSWVHDLPQTWQRDQDVFLLEIGRMQAIDVDILDDAGVLQFLCCVRDLGERYFLPNIAISFAQRNIYALLYGIIAGKLGRERAPAIFDALLAPAETRTALVNRDAMALSAHLRRNPVLHAAVRSAEFAAGLPRDIAAAWPSFADAWIAFLVAHGHRETDIDLISPTWGEAPAVVRDLLLALADGSQHDDHNTQRWQKRKLAVQAQQQLLDTHDDYRYTTNEVIELARIYTVLDDVEHYQTTRLHPLFRRGALTLARRWFSQGALPCIDSVFCLDFDELALAVAQGPDAVRAIAEREWSVYLDAKARTPRWSMDEVAEVDADGAGDAADGNQRSGVPGSPGIVEGTIFVVRGTEDFGHMPAGAVLVARTTNPAWTPLFYRASAVITESGGQLSHGAVTARELGLPAVMSVRGVLQWLHDGDRVRVDGQRGRVQKLA